VVVLSWPLVAAGALVVAGAVPDPLAAGAPAGSPAAPADFALAAVSLFASVLFVVLASDALPADADPLAGAAPLLAAGVFGGEADCAIGSHQPGPNTIATAATNPTAPCSHRRAAEGLAITDRGAMRTACLVLMRSAQC